MAKCHWCQETIEIANQGSRYCNPPKRCSREMKKFREREGGIRKYLRDQRKEYERLESLYTRLRTGLKKLLDDLED